MCVRSAALLGSLSEHTPHQFSWGSEPLSLLSVVEPEGVRFRPSLGAGWAAAALGRSLVPFTGRLTGWTGGAAVAAPRFLTSSHGIESSAIWFRNGLLARSTGSLGAGAGLSSPLAKTAYRLWPGGPMSRLVASELKAKRWWSGVLLALGCCWSWWLAWACKQPTRQQARCQVTPNGWEHGTPWHCREDRETKHRGCWGAMRAWGFSGVTRAIMGRHMERVTKVNGRCEGEGG